MVTVYGIPNCNSVKKAIDWLKANGIDYRFHDYKKLGITYQKIDEWFSQISWERFVNKAGTTFKQLPDELKQSISSSDSAKALMLEKNSVIKRPVIESDKVIAIGFDEKVFSEVLL
jgi:arsenate reductase (glutaredoxin)